MLTRLSSRLLSLQAISSGLLVIRVDGDGKGSGAQTRRQGYLTGPWHYPMDMIETPVPPHPQTLQSYTTTVLS